MIQIKTILWRVLAAFALLLQASIAEEQHSVILDLNSTTLSGFVDSSAISGIGARVTVGYSTGGLETPVGPYLGTSGAEAGPANDQIGTAAAVEGNSISLPASLTNATLQVGEPTQPQQTGSIWYSWQVQQTGVARVSMAAFSEPLPIPSANSFAPALTEESIFFPDGGVTVVTVGGVSTYTTVGTVYLGPIGYYRWSTMLAVYRFVQTSLGETNIEFVARGSSLEFTVHENEVLYLAVEVYERGPAYDGEIEIPSSLTGTLYFDLTPTPINDSFASGLSISDSSAGYITGYSRASTREPSEPDLGGDFSGGSVWFHYTAATYGPVTIGYNPFGLMDNTPLAVFTGGELANLKLVAKTKSGGVRFFGEQGKTYHIAVYNADSTAGGFSLGFIAPIYRVYETTLDALMPGGLFPHFYGIRGATMLAYAKSATGWDCVEIEPIMNRAADLAIYPTNAVDGQLRIVTIDEPLPSPRVVLRPARGLMVPDLVGIPGQTCAVSFSTDLINWSQPKVYTLDSATRVLDAIGPTGLENTYFFRVTQSMPEPTASISIGVTETTPAHPTGVVITTTHSGGGGIPAPPFPLP